MPNPRAQEAEKDYDLEGSLGLGIEQLVVYLPSLQESLG